MSVEFWLPLPSGKILNIVDLSKNFYHMPSKELKEKTQGVIYTFSFTDQVCSLTTFSKKKRKKILGGFQWHK
jgi:hypothetical protein